MLPMLETFGKLAGFFIQGEVATHDRPFLSIPSAVSRKWLDMMKPMDFFARQGAAPQPYWAYGKGAQRSMAEKDAVSCRVICETLH